MAIDLTGPQAIAESVLFGGVDSCSIVRESVAQTSFDVVTGAYTIPAGSAVYAGKCSLRDQSTSSLGGQLQQGAVPATLQRWICKIPLASPEVKVGDVITITAARDVTLVGQRFVVRDIGGGTFRLVKTLAVERWEPGNMQDWAKPGPS